MVMGGDVKSVKYLIIWKRTKGKTSEPETSDLAVRVKLITRV